MKKHKIIVESKADASVRTLAEAKAYAAEYGMSFVIFIGGLADRHVSNVEDARKHAQYDAAFVGRENVRIKRVTV